MTSPKVQIACSIYGSRGEIKFGSGFRVLCVHFCDGISLLAADCFGELHTIPLAHVYKIEIMSEEFAMVKGRIVTKSDGDDLFPITRNAIRESDISVKQFIKNAQAAEKKERTDAIKRSEAFFNVDTGW